MLKKFLKRSLYPTPRSSQVYSPFLKIQKGNAHGKRCLHMWAVPLPGPTLSIKHLSWWIFWPSGLLGKAVPGEAGRWQRRTRKQIKNGSKHILINNQWAKYFNQKTWGDWLYNKKKKQDSSICCLQETQYRIKDTCRLKVRGRKRSFHIWKCKKS